MKAVVCEKYGPPDVLQLQELEDPIPKEHEVLIRVHAATVATPDWRVRKADPWITRLIVGLRGPRQKVLGIEFAGVVEGVGKNVSLFREGDQVFGANLDGSVRGNGAYAEFLRILETGFLALKPAGMTYEEAAAVPTGALTALTCLRKANVERGNKVLVYGASGSIGTYAVQLAKYFGAEVTGVCSTGNLEMVKSLGADDVIDYTKEDYATNIAAYDLVLDTVGKSSFRHCRNALKERGAYLSAGPPSPGYLLRALWTAKMGKKKVLFLGISKPHVDDLVFFKDLIEAGRLRAVIDRCYPLEQIADAHRHAQKGHKKGNVAIRINEPEAPSD